MDVRQFKLYIDGRRLPRLFLRNRDTQMGVFTYMRFDGLVERFDTIDNEPVGEPVCEYDPLPDAPFAQLDGHALCFRLRPEDGGYVSVRLASELRDCVARIQLQGEGNEILDFARHDAGHWWRLESGNTYVISLEYVGARTQMTVKAVRCREPLLDLSRALLNRQARLC